MKPIVASKLMRKCLILAVMILGLVYIALSDRYYQPTLAAPCCESCAGDGDPTIGEDNCGVYCTYAVSPQFFQDCFDDCTYYIGLCYRHCIYCNSNSPPGGACTSTSDCAINYYCGADDLCHSYN